MQDFKVLNYIKEVLKNRPEGWLNITTHRLDLYEERLAKTQFLDEFERLYNETNSDSSALNALPTAYDYIRLGHPLSCVLEWGIAKTNAIKSENVISFSSQTIPVLAVLRKNKLEHIKTQILYIGDLPRFFDAEIIRTVYGYHFDLKKITDVAAIPQFEGSTVYISNETQFGVVDLPAAVDFHIGLYGRLGSILIVNGTQNERYISDIQHVRRRETIAMTPDDCLTSLNYFIAQTSIDSKETSYEANKSSVLDSIKTVTGSSSKPLVASSGLSIQYAIMMGLIHNAVEKHKGKAIKIVVPPNCYGGTNDQARRVAECIDNVEIVDLLVDGANDMVQSIDQVLAQIANEDAVPYIIAEIPTNPRVEVPNLIELKAVLTKERKTPSGGIAIDPVFILDQTFCPNVHFLGEGQILSTIRTISFASGSKFPSGGQCTAGYCVGNTKTDDLMEKIGLHLTLCDNEATALQYKILARQLPSMNQRIVAAYQNTREFVRYIHEVLPDAKINFVSDELAAQGFTPSVFSLDLPTKGTTAAEKEAYKRDLNLKLIHLMISEIPEESKFCVSYGQLKGCYWTVPATSTQGTTKEGDKDYIVRASLSGNMNLQKHKDVFSKFVEGI
jgi:cystathionine beta-lyase/cystathionine gamma-synthase